VYEIKKGWVKLNWPPKSRMEIKIHSTFLVLCIML
jgi:hypothetical protein